MHFRSRWRELGVLGMVFMVLYPHTIYFSDTETEKQGRKGTFPRLHSKKEASENNDDH